MTTYQPRYTFPENLPTLMTPVELGHIARAVTIAGIYVDNSLEACLTDPQKRAELERSVSKKSGADVVTKLDKESEQIMAAIMRMSGYDGGIFSEEGIVSSPKSKRTLVLDGIDGTEAARSRIAGKESPYGPSAGIVYDDRGVIVPMTGAVYLPRQKRGFVGPTDKEKILEFQVTRKKDEVYEVSGVKEVPCFDKDRTDVKYMLSFFLEGEEKFPEWVKNLYVNANNAGEQNILHASGAQVDYLAKLVEECGNRSLHVGPSAAIGAKGTRLHDIMGLAPAIIALGGIVGNMDGAILGENIEFIPERYRRVGKNPLAILKAAGMIPKMPIGPVISAQNEKIYQQVREYMTKDG